MLLSGTMRENRQKKLTTNYYLLTTTYTMEPGQSRPHEKDGNAVSAVPIKMNLSESHAFR
jgi:hypothetical protein